MKKLLLFGLALGLSGVALAQEPVRNCGTTDYVKNLIQKDPSYITTKQDIDNFTANWVATHAGQKAGGVITIPVVVHVVWNTNAENISDAQVQSQITVLNKDYRRTNADAGQTPSVWTAIAADCNIEFCLATKDPNGATTTGITRTQTNKTSFDINQDDIKFTSDGGKDAWPRASYLNIWVGDIGAGLLGYATPPGGPAANDGVVIGYQYFGTMGTAQSPFNKGRTATHEVGHWLNLEHIWGDDGSSCNGTDQVNDTPNQADENYGCPNFPAVSCNNGPNGDMFMNYMDYTDDGCMNMFTQGQSTRMNACLNGARASIQSSQGCSGGTVDPPTGECDTLANFSGSANLVVYAAQDDNGNFAGYISGTNSYADNAKVDKFTGIPSNCTVSGGLFGFARAYSTNASRQVTFAVWNASGNAPGTEIASTSVSIQSITEGVYTPVTFSANPVAPSTLFMGIRWSGLTGSDSLALYTTEDGSTNTAWDRWSDNTWHEYSESGNWGISVAHAVAPVICPLVGVNEENIWEGVSVFPNPTDGNINVYLKLKITDDVQIRVFNPMGQVIQSQNAANTFGGMYNFDLSSQANGLYFVEVGAGNITRTFKVIVSR